ncbi:MAG: SGNH/GDSL hydrolase family protein, partial [Clostridia bacterium]|nr:SGNH/GDSL hydrolase family protein [Clostridia bacterium]
MTDKADIVSVMGGVNDYLNAPLGTPDSTDTGTIYGALNVLCAGLKAKYPNAYVFFMTPYKFSMDPGAHPDYGHTLCDVANAIKEVCGKYGFDVLDMYTYGKFELEMYTKGSDGLHPTQEFFSAHTAPMIARFIKENYKKPSV